MQGEALYVSLYVRAVKDVRVSACAVWTGKDYRHSYCTRFTMKHVTHNTQDDSTA